MGPLRDGALEVAMFDLVHDFGKPGPRRPVLMMLD